MVAQQGFVYEQNAAAILKKMGIVPANFTPAGASHDQPDLIIQHKKLKSGCELKITAASAGSLVMKYNFKTNMWMFNDIDPRDEEKYFIVQLAKEIKLFNEINRKWKEKPYKRDKQFQDEAWKLSIGKDTRKMYERDKKVFQDIIGEIPASKIEQYYNKKNTYYVNVGTHGFYLMGARNPLGLKGVPSFGTSAKATWRARVQYKGSGNYQFTFEMQFSIPVAKKSPYNIAPVNGKSVTIEKEKINVGCFT